MNCSRPTGMCSCMTHAVVRRICLEQATASTEQDATATACSYVSGGTCYADECLLTLEFVCLRWWTCSSNATTLLFTTDRLSLTHISHDSFAFPNIRYVRSTAVKSSELSRTGMCYSSGVSQGASKIIFEQTRQFGLFGASPSIAPTLDPIL
jgi:hypothetical protein